MKILCVGDLHITLATREFIGGVFRAHLLEVIAVAHPDAVIFLGDTLDYDTNVCVPAMDCAIDLFTAVSALVADVFVLVGNHDYADPHQFMTDNHWMKSLKSREGLHVIDCAREAVVETTRFIVCPYVPPARFMEMLDTTPFWPEANVIFAHQGFNGAQWRSGKIVDEVDWARDLPPIVSGHIHVRQTLESGVWYPGSIEMGKQNYLLMVEVGRGEVAMRWLKMGFLTTAKRVCAVAELDPTLTNCEITVQDTSENLRHFKTTPEFATLSARNRVRLVAQSMPFLDLYRKNILATGERYTFCAAEKVLTGEEQDESNHMFIRIN
jgi:predicted phosphodiesterase